MFNMKNFAKSKKVWLIIFLLLLTFSIFSFIKNIKLSRNIHENVVGGKIVAKYQNSLQIEDVRKENKNIFVNENTQIIKGKENLKYSDLATGTFVFVELNKNIIRIIDPKTPPFRKQNEN